MRTLRPLSRSARALLSVLAAGTLVTSSFALLPRSTFADTDLDVGGVAVIAYANGDSVRLRDGMSTDSDVIDEFDEGTEVNVLDGPGSGDDGSLWYRVSVDGEHGYINADFLANSSALLDSTSGTAYAISTLNVRSGPSTADDVVTSLDEGDAVTLTGNSQDGWLSVDVDGADGWVYSAFVTQDGGASTSDSVGGDSFALSDTMYTSDTVNLRSGASTERRIRATLPPGTAVYPWGNQEDGFAEVSTDDYGDGWVAAEYLTDTKPKAAKKQSSSDSSSDDSSSDDSSSDSGSSDSVTTAAETPTPSVGEQMVNFAMQFLGQAYVWAGASPGGFDCSGLTEYVAANVLGMSLPHSTELQIGYGTAVDWNDLQPGDLVFFANTYEAGISHVGIYIGDGNFIHAENYDTGVVITSLSDPYYVAHYAGARRLA